MSSSSKRKNLTPDQKLAAVRERLMDKVPISEICEKYNCAPSNFYKWQNSVLNDTAEVLEKKKNANLESRQLNNAMVLISKLQKRLEEKNAAIAELVDDNIRQKKNLNGQI
jgi:transposase